MPRPADSSELEAALEGYRSVEPNGSFGSLHGVTDKEAGALDAVRESRLLYSISLLRLRGFLSEKPPGFQEAGVQASMALKYIQHCENRGLRNLQLGRNRNDEAFARELDDLRSQLTQMAHEKARLLSRSERNRGEQKE